MGKYNMVQSKENACLWYLGSETFERWRLIVPPYKVVPKESSYFFPEPGELSQTRVSEQGHAQVT